jgi:hypothetical protein
VIPASGADAKAPGSRGAMSAAYSSYASDERPAREAERFLSRTAAGSPCRSALDDAKRGAERAAFALERSEPECIGVC